MKILVYGGEGTSSFSLSETLKLFYDTSDAVEVIDHDFLREEAWEKKTKLIVFPGGRDIPYNQNLKGKGTEKIRKFVEKGGSYLGICAGAYFGASKVIFEKGTPLEVDEKRELQFFPGAAIGTLYPQKTFSYHSETGTHPSKISFGKTSLHLYYNGGCTFEMATTPSGVEVLAHYLDVDNKPAIIHCKVGKGNVILSGVHFEISPRLLRTIGCPPSTCEKLKNSDEKRKNLATSLLSYLL